MQVMLSLSQAFLTISSVQRGLGGGRKTPSGALETFSLRAEDADVGFHFVVIRREIFVGDGPIVAEAIARAGLEIDGSEAQSDAAPVIGAAADDARTKPLEICAGSGGVRFAVDFPGAVGRQEFAEIFRGLAANADAAMRQVRTAT